MNVSFAVLSIFLILGLVLTAIIAVIVVIVVIVTSKSRKQQLQSLRMPAYQQPTEIYQPPVPAEEGQQTPPQPRMSLGEIIKSNRVRCGMTQEYVAEAMNVSRQAVSKWETDAAEPSTSNLLALAKLFGISAGELLEGVEQSEN